METKQTEGFFEPINVTQYKTDKTLKFEVSAKSEVRLVLKNKRNKKQFEINIAEKSNIRLTSSNEFVGTHFKGKMFSPGEFINFKLTWYDNDIILQKNGEIILHVGNYLSHSAGETVSEVEIMSGEAAEWKFNSFQSMDPTAPSHYPSLTPPFEAEPPSYEPLWSPDSIYFGSRQLMCKNNVLTPNTMIVVAFDDASKNTPFNKFEFKPLRKRADGKSIYKIQIGDANDKCLETKHDIGHVFSQKNGHFDYSADPVIGIWESHPNQHWELDWVTDTEARIRVGAPKGREYCLTVVNSIVKMEKFNARNPAQIFKFNARVPEFDIENSTIKIQEQQESYFRTADGRTFIPSFADVKPGHHIHEWTGPSKPHCSAHTFLEKDSEKSEEFYINFTKYGSDPQCVVDVAVPGWMFSKGEKPSKYAPNTLVHMHTKHGCKNQRFKIERIEGTTCYMIRSVGNLEMALDLTHPHPCGWAGTDNLFHLRLQKADKNKRSQWFNLDGMKVKIGGEDRGYMNPEFLI